MDVSLRPKGAKKGYAISGSPYIIEVVNGFRNQEFRDTVGFDIYSLEHGGSAHLDAVQKSIVLTESRPSEVGGVWMQIPQRLELGFVAAATFRIRLASRFCPDEHRLSTCYSRAGDGMALVLQNGYRSPKGDAGAQLGYGGIPNSIAIEIDTFYNQELGDRYGTHVSVMTMGTAENSASHEAAAIATSSDVPNAADGWSHHLKVEFTPGARVVDLDLESYVISPIGVELLRKAKRPGVIKVWLDDLRRPILSTILDLESLLMLANSGGRAWIGFTAATGNEAWAKQELLSLEFRDFTCPGDCTMRGVCKGDGSCRCDEGFTGDDCARMEGDDG
jgi:hypothetical protein